MRRGVGAPLAAFGSVRGEKLGSRPRREASSERRSASISARTRADASSRLSAATHQRGVSWAPARMAGTRGTKRRPGVEHGTERGEVQLAARDARDRASRRVEPGEVDRLAGGVGQRPAQRVAQIEMREQRGGEHEARPRLALARAAIAEELAQRSLEAVEGIGQAVGVEAQHFAARLAHLERNAAFVAAQDGGDAAEEHQLVAVRRRARGATVLRRETGERRRGAFQQRAARGIAARRGRGGDAEQRRFERFGIDAGVASVGGGLDAGEHAERRRAEQAQAAPRSERPARRDRDRGAAEIVRRGESRRDRERGEPGVAAFGRHAHHEPLPVARGADPDDAERRRDVVAARRFERFRVHQPEAQDAAELLRGIEPAAPAVITATATTPAPSPEASSHLSSPPPRA